MQAARSNDPHEPGGLRPTFVKPWTTPPLNEDEFPNSRPHGVLASEELDLAIQHVVGLGLPVVDVG